MSYLITYYITIAEADVRQERVMKDKNHIIAMKVKLRFYLSCIVVYTIHCVHYHFFHGLQHASL